MWFKHGQELERILRKLPEEERKRVAAKIYESKEFTFWCNGIEYTIEPIDWDDGDPRQGGGE